MKELNDDLGRENPGSAWIIPNVKQNRSEKTAKIKSVAADRPSNIPRYC